MKETITIEFEFLPHKNEEKILQPIEMIKRTVIFENKIIYQDECVPDIYLKLNDPLKQLYKLLFIEKSKAIEFNKENDAYAKSWLEVFRKILNQTLQ